MVKAISPYQEYCVGYQNPGIEGCGYLMGLAIGVGKVEQALSHAGSAVLDNTLAFDRAEVEEINLGQINMITVSSFCGLQGKMWGLDLVKADSLRAEVVGEVEGVKIYSGQPLIEATRKLFGSVKEPRFPLLPGSHVPCATKNVMLSGPKRLYAGIGVGVPQDRERAACLMMEDVGEMSDLTEEELMLKIAESIVEVGKNQRVKYKEVFTSIKVIDVGVGEVGCALVAAPYFAIAQNAIPGGRYEELEKISLGEWSKLV